MEEKAAAEVAAAAPVVVLEAVEDQQALVEAAVPEEEDRQTLVEAEAAGVVSIEVAVGAASAEAVAGDRDQVQSVIAANPIEAEASIVAAVATAPETRTFIAVVISQATEEAQRVIEERTRVEIEVATLVPREISIHLVTLTTSDGQTLGLVLAPLDSPADLAVSGTVTALEQATVTADLATAV